MSKEEAIEVLKLVEENVSCDDCLYYAQMEDCPTDEDCIIVQAVRMAKQALSQEPTDRIEYGTDGNAYKLWISNGKEYEQDKWGNGCKTSEDGYCYLFEPQESEDKE